MVAGRDDLIFAMRSASSCNNIGRVLLAAENSASNAASEHQPFVGASIALAEKVFYRVRDGGVSRQGEDEIVASIHAVYDQLREGSDIKDMADKILENRTPR